MRSCATAEHVVTDAGAVRGWSARLDISLGRGSLVAEVEEVTQPSLRMTEREPNAHR